MPDTLPATLHLRHGSSSGQPITRRDGPLKVTGRATFAADNRPPEMLHAVIATGGIARGRVAALDEAAARAHPGVVAVMTPANRPPLAFDPDERDTPFAFRLDLLQNDRVRYAGQPIAVVIAETLEAATEGDSKPRSGSGTLTATRARRGDGRACWRRQRAGRAGRSGRWATVGRRCWVNCGARWGGSRPAR